MARAHQIGAKVPDYPGRKTMEGVLGPVTAGTARKYAGHVSQRLMGFWAMWHSVGGFDAIRAEGLMSRSAIYKQLGEFEDVFGCSIEDWQPVLAGAVRASTIKAELLGAPVSDPRHGEQLRLAE